MRRRLGNSIASNLLFIRRVSVTNDVVAVVTIHQPDNDYVDNKPPAH